MWRVLRLRPLFQHPTWTKLSKNVNVKLSVKVGSAAFIMPHLIFLDVSKTVPTEPPTPSTKTTAPILTIPAPEDHVVVKKDVDSGWHLSIRDVMHVTKLLLVGGLVWGISGALLGGALFKMCTLAGYHITRWVSIPTCILSGAAVSLVGLHRGLGHSLIHFIHTGLTGHVLKKVVSTRVGDATVIHWDAAVTRITYSFKLKAKQSGFFAAMALRSLAKRLESYLLLVKDEDKLLKHGNLTEEVINHKLTKVIRRQMRKPVYIVGLAYGAAITTVAVLVWKS